MAKLDLGLPRYMGRGIIFGFTTQHDPAAVYFAEGRSPASRERRLELYPGQGRVYMNLNSETSIEEMRKKGGNPDLLLYNAFRGNRDGLLVVGNGFQTDSDPIWEGQGREAENLRGSKSGGGIYYSIYNQGYDIKDAIEKTLWECGSEVDPLRTARIACAADFEDIHTSFYIGIVIRPRDINDHLTDKDKLRLSDFPFDEKGKFTIFATYGVHDPPYDGGLPPEIVRPNDFTTSLHLDGTNPEQLVEEVFEALPKEILVGVAATMRDVKEPQGFRFAGKNIKD